MHGNWGKFRRIRDDPVLTVTSVENRMEISWRQLDRHRLVKRMFTLRQVQMFETVARLGSYSKAAEELGVSQPSVSVQVQELEKELGTDLFERAGRRSRLTEIGTAFYPRAARILAAVEESLVEVDSFLGLERGRVRAGAIESMGLYLLPSSMREFGESHPGIDLELTIETPDEIAAGLRSGRMDIGFGDRSLADEASIESIELRVVEFVVITSREHPLALQQKVPAAKLAGETFIVEGDASPSMWGLEWLASRVDGDGPNVGMQVTSCDALKRMVRANLGIAVTYDFCVEWEYSASLIHTLNIAELSSAAHLYACHMQGQELAPAAGEFLRLAMASIGEGSGRKH